MWQALFENTLALYLDAAPWLLFGLLAAGLVKAWVPEKAMRRWLGGSGAGPVVKAAIVGAPLPLCSCGVLPAALGLRRAGASRGATVSFLVATPETGVDSVAVSYALLGPFMAVVRPVAAIVSAIAAGLAAGMVREPAPAAMAAAACGCDTGCCGTTAPPSPAPGAWRRSLDGMRYAMTDILDDIALWLAGGILLAAVLVTLLPPLALAEWGQGPLAMLVMLVIGIPLYICATASTPLAAGLLAAGVSPGAVLVFLLVGPATNLGSLAILGRELGRRTLVAYLGGIAVSALAVGMLTDWLVAAWAVPIYAQMGVGGEVLPAWITWSAAVLLLVLAIRPARRLWLGQRKD